MPTKAPAKKAGAAKKAAKATKATKAPAAEENGGGRTRGVDLKVAKQIAKSRDNGSSWADISEEFEMSTGKAMLYNLYARVDDDDRITGTDAAVAKAVVKERNAGNSWGVLSARTGLPESRLRKIFEEQTGESARGNRIGKGGRYPDDEKPDSAPAKKSATKKAAAPTKKTGKAAAPAKKAGKAAKAGKAQGADSAPSAINTGEDHPLVDWSLDQIKARLDGKTIKVTREGDRTESIKVRSVKKKSKDGELTLIDENGKSRTVLAVQIRSATK